MRTNIVESAHLARFEERDQHGSGCKLELFHEIAVWHGQLLDAANAEPGALENLLALQLEILAGGIRQRRNGPGIQAQCLGVMRPGQCGGHHASSPGPAKDPLHRDSACLLTNVSIIYTTSCILIEDACSMERVLAGVRLR